MTGVLHAREGARARHQSCCHTLAFAELTPLVNPDSRVSEQDSADLGQALELQAARRMAVLRIYSRYTSS